MRKKSIGAAIINLISFGVIVTAAWLLLLSNFSEVGAGSGSFTVCTGGPPTCDFDNVQSAVDAAGSGDIIKIAAGTYTGINQRAGASQLVFLDKSLTLQGGYNTTFTEPPDPTNNPTILDANGTGRVFYITGADGALIAGLRITGGYVNGSDDRGGGMAVISSSVTIEDNWIYSNTSQLDRGGGIYLLSSSFMLNDNEIYDNNSSSSGGGLYIAAGSGVADGNTVRNNMANGVFITGGVVTFTNNLIEGNQNSYNAGLVAGNGSIWVTNNIISGNVATYYGGGVTAGLGNIVISGNVIQGNQAQGCAGFDISGSSAHFFENSVTGNMATSYDGGGGCSGTYDPIIEDNYFSGNSAVRYGGGFHGGGPDASLLDGNIFVGNSAGCGGGLSFYEGGRTFSNNIVADNQAPNGAGLCILGGSHTLQHNTFARNLGANGIRVIRSTGMAASAVFTNTILVGHTTGMFVSTDGTVSMEGTLWGSGSWSNVTDWVALGSGSIMTGTVNVWGDPDFINPNAGNYHVNSGSAAVDSGVSSNIVLDIDDDPRPLGNGYDIGADEATGEQFIYLPVVLIN